MVMSNNLKLRVASIFILAGCSFLGVMLPLVGYQGKLYQRALPLMQTGAAGIMLGLAIIHLAPDANETLDEIVPDYPIGYALIGLGIILVLSIEQFVLMYAAARREAYNLRESKKLLQQKSQSPIPPTRSLSGGDIEHNEDCGFVQCTHTPSTAASNSSTTAKTTDAAKRADDYHNTDFYDHGHSHHGHQQQNVHDHSQCGGSHPQSHSIDGHSHGHDHADHEALAVEDLARAESLQDLVLAYALEMSTAVHSIIIGVNLGLLGLDSDYDKVSVLLVALCFHQFVEGLGVGNVIESNKKSLGTTKIVIFVTIFSFTVSLGVLIGILTASQGESESQLAAKGAATSLAAGSLLYTSLVEMTAKYFEQPILNKQPCTRISMLFAFVVGFLFMAIIGVWA